MEANLGDARRPLDACRHRNSVPHAHFRAIYIRHYRESAYQCGGSFFSRLMRLPSTAM
jgi:hypothetical protein